MEYTKEYWNKSVTQRMPELIELLLKTAKINGHTVDRYKHIWLIDKSPISTHCQANAYLDLYQRTEQLKLF